MQSALAPAAAPSAPAPAAADEHVPILSADTAEIRVTVDAITQEADGVLGIRLVALDQGDLPAWTPGAHIDLLLDENLERQYSLCGDPQDRRHWRIAALRETKSRGGSEWLHSRLRLGDILRVRGPRNHFELVDAAAYLFIAGGIGITPLLPMLREASCRGVPWRFLYGGRNTQSMAFASELAAYGERVHMCPEDRHGLLDLNGFLGEPRRDVAIYCCGPERLLAAVESLCEKWPDGALHVERFQARPGALDGVSAEFEVVLAKSKVTCKVGANESIIDALDRVGVHVPRSCGEGTCGTCLTPVIEGIPDHRDSFLMGKKRASNSAMCVCCSRSKVPRLVLNL